MRLTTTANSFKISIQGSELSDLVKELGFRDISEMVSEGMTDLISEIAARIKTQKGIDITEGREEDVPIAVMIINDIMLIEVPKKDTEGAMVDVMERPEERFKGFMEHLKKALEKEAAKSEKPSNTEDKAKDQQLLFKVPSMGEAMRGASWVKKGWIIRWRGQLYIETDEYSAGLLEHFEGRTAPRAMQSDEIISFIKDGRVCKYDPKAELGLSDEEVLKMGKALKKAGIIREK